VGGSSQKRIGLTMRAGWKGVNRFNYESWLERKQWEVLSEGGVTAGETDTVSALKFSFSF
jgi:hypothetical protein